MNFLMMVKFLANSKFFLSALKLEDELKEHKDLLINNELSNNKIN